MFKTAAFLAFGNGKHDDHHDKQIGQDVLGRLAKNHHDKGYRVEHGRNCQTGGRTNTGLG